MSPHLNDICSDHARINFRQSCLRGCEAQARADDGPRNSHLFAGAAAICASGAGELA